MDEPERLDFLRGLDHLTGWPEHRIRAVSRACCEVDVGAGVALGGPHADPAEVLIVVTGRIVVEWPDHSRRLLGPGDIGSAVGVTMLSLEATTVLCIGRLAWQHIEQDDES